MGDPSGMVHSEKISLTPEKFEGCLLGLALGDALGARFEGGIAERALWWFIGTTREGHMRWTDDTQMSLEPRRER